MSGLPVGERLRRLRVRAGLTTRDVVGLLAGGFVTGYDVASVEFCEELGHEFPSAVTPEVFTVLLGMYRLSPAEEQDIRDGFAAFLERRRREDARPREGDVVRSIVVAVLSRSPWARSPRSGLPR